MGSEGVFIIGAGGHGASLLETVTASGHRVIAYVDPNATSTLFHGLPVLPAVPEGSQHNLMALGVGSNRQRQLLFDRLSKHICLDRFPSFVHPTASVAASAVIGPGSVVMQGAIVASAARIGAFCVCNSGSILEHECVMGDFSSLAPGAVAAGRVTIGRRSEIAMGACIMQGLSVGDDSVLGANSYLNRDLGGSLLAYGTPARVVRST